MEAKRRASGFKYIYETENPDIAIVRFKADGVGGLLGLTRLEWVIARTDLNSMARCCAELVTKAPLWTIENGDVAVAQEEVQRWADPILYDAMRESL